MAKSTTIKVKLVSSADTGFYYVTKKNSRTMTDKLVMKKYDPSPRSTSKSAKRRSSSRLRSADAERAPFRALFAFWRVRRRMVAGRKRCHEEATHTAPGPAEPHGCQEMRRT
jgi:large subunit ribosomal protein L33